MSIAVHWFRNGLRLHDNPALIEAINNADKLITLYIFDEETFGNHNYTTHNVFGAVYTVHK
jgi:cryptochrome